MSSVIKNRKKTTPQVVTSPITGAQAVTPSDSGDLDETSTSLYVGTAGTLKVSFEDNTTVTYGAVAAGRHPLRVKRVWATGTSASNIVAEF
mgnify:CR=1 FL=1